MLVKIMEFSKETKIACDIQSLGEISIGVQMMKAIGESNHYFENYMEKAVTSSQVQALFCACAGKALKSAHEFDAISGVKVPSVLGHYCIYSRPEEEGDMEKFGELNAEKCADLDGVAFSGVKDGMFYVFGGLFEDGRFSLIRDGIEWTRIGADIFDGLEFAGVHVMDEIRKFHEAKLPVIPAELFEFLWSWGSEENPFDVSYESKIFSLSDGRASENSKEIWAEQLAKIAWKLAKIKEPALGQEMKKAVAKEIRRIFG